jgi:hypothetical protein
MLCVREYVIESSAPHPGGQGRRTGAHAGRPRAVQRSRAGAGVHFRPEAYLHIRGGLGVNARDLALSAVAKAASYSVIGVDRDRMFRSPHRQWPVVVESWSGGLDRGRSARSSMICSTRRCGVYRPMSGSAARSRMVIAAASSACHTTLPGCGQYSRSPTRFPRKPVPGMTCEV